MLLGSARDRLNLEKYRKDLLEDSDLLLDDGDQRLPGPTRHDWISVNTLAYELRVATTSICVHILAACRRNGLLALSNRAVRIHRV